MKYEEKLISYATAPRATAGKITQIVDGELVEYWVGRLRGKFVSMGGKWKFSTKAEALELARRYRYECKKEAVERGLISESQRSGG